MLELPLSVDSQPTKKTNATKAIGTNFRVALSVIRSSPSFRHSLWPFHNSDGGAGWISDDSHFAIEHLRSRLNKHFPPEFFGFRCRFRYVFDAHKRQPGWFHLGMRRRDRSHSRACVTLAGQNIIAQPVARRILDD